MWSSPVSAVSPDRETEIREGAIDIFVGEGYDLFHIFPAVRKHKMTQHCTHLLILSPATHRTF